MSEVKRFTYGERPGQHPETATSSVIESDDGEYILYSDYDKLRQQVAELESKLVKCREALTSIANNSCCGDCQEAKRVAQQTLKETSAEAIAECIDAEGGE